MVKLPRNGQWGQLLQQASRSIDGGETLAAAIAANQPQSRLMPPYFDVWTLGVLRLAETSGALAAGCRQLAIAALQERDRRRLETAIGRSLLALVIGGLTLGLLLLTWSTAFVMQTGFWIVVITVGLGFSWVWQQAYYGPLRATLTPYLRQWPVLKSLWEAQACLYLSELATPLRCGIPILAGLDLMRRHVPDPEWAKTLTLMIHGVRSGRSLSHILAGRMPELALQLIRTGEEAGALDEMLTKLGEYGQERLAMTLRQVETLLRPVGILAIGGTVAITAIQLFTGTIQQLPD